MQYEIYIDIVFLINMWMDFLLLLFLRQTLKKRISVWWMLLTSALCSVTSCILMFYPMPAILKSMLSYLLLPIFLVCFGLRLYEIKQIGKAIVILYSSAFLFGGVFYVVRKEFRTGGLFFVLASLICCCLTGLFQRIVAIKKEQNTMCEVVLYEGQKEWIVPAFVDTGNQLMDPFFQKPVHIIAEGLFRDMELENDLAEAAFHYIPYRTIQGEGVLPAIRVEKMVIRSRADQQTILVEHPILGISKEKLSKTEKYQILLNAEVFSCSC